MDSRKLSILEVLADHKKRHPDPHGQPCDYHCVQQLIADCEAALAAAGTEPTREQIAKLRIDSIPAGQSKAALQSVHSWNQAIDAVLALFPALKADGKTCEWEKAVCTVHGGMYYVRGTLACDKSGVVTPPGPVDEAREDREWMPTEEQAEDISAASGFPHHPDPVTRWNIKTVVGWAVRLGIVQPVKPATRI